MRTPTDPSGPDPSGPDPRGPAPSERAATTATARRLLRRLVVAAATAALTVTVAYASVGLAPVGAAGDLTGHGGAEPSTERDGSGRPPWAGGPGGPGDPDPGDPTDPGDPADPAPPTVGGPVPDGTALVHVGAARRSIDPRPAEGEVWKRDLGACGLLDPSTLEQAPGMLADVLARTGSPWPQDPDCLYLGGYGIGPMNPMVDVDEEHGLSARAVALRGTDGGTFVLVVVDGIGWMWERQHTCVECGAQAIASRLGDELGIDPAGIWIHATHSHTSPDFMGAWGGVPGWYLAQVTATIEDTVRDAVVDLRPAVLEVGEVIARGHNRERRSTYRSAEEAHLGFARALAVTDDGSRFLLDPAREAADGDRAPAVVATLGTYAAHPTTVSASAGVADPDWPARFERRVEDRDGGLALHAMTGLGNLSTAGGTQMGVALADELPAPGTARLLRRADVRVASRTLVHPVSNLPLTVLGVPGFVDRTFLLEPASVRTGQRPDTAPCVSAAPASVEAPIAAVRIGDELALTAGPGELYANLTNTLKERSGARVTLPLSQVNDALGYVGQSFELDRESQQGLGFAADGYGWVDYEDSYAIDVCFGDEVLERSLELLADLAG
jgi:hypothetical protein